MAQQQQQSHEGRRTSIRVSPFFRLSLLALLTYFSPPRPDNMWRDTVKNGREKGPGTRSRSNYDSHFYVLLRRPRSQEPGARSQGAGQLEGPLIRLMAPNWGDREATWPRAAADKSSSFLLPPFRAKCTQNYQQFEWRCKPAGRSFPNSLCLQI